MSGNRIDEIYNMPAIQAQFNQVFKLMDEMARRIKELSKITGNINLSGAKGSGSAGQAQDAINAANLLERAKRRLELAESALGKAIENVNDKTRQQNLQNRQSARETNSSATSLDNMRAVLARLTREFDRMTAAQRNNDSVGGAQVRRIQQLQREIRELENLTGRAQRNVGNYPNKLVGGLQGFLGGAGVGVGLGVAGAGVVAKQIFDTTLKLDSLNAALRTVSKTEQEYATNQQFLLQTSERLGLNILTLTDNYKLFYTASTQAGLSARTTRQIFQSVSEAGARLRLSNDQISGAFLALSQTISKGKVQAEELRGQLAERIPGAFSIAARAIGVTEQQLNKMLERGEVIASEFLPKFARELQKTFGVESTEVVEGLQASVNRLSNEFTKLVSSNQSGLSRFFASIINFMRDALGGFNSFLEKVQNVDLGNLGRQLGGDISREDITRNTILTENEISSARREALKAGNDSYIKAFKEASQKERKAMLQEAEKMEQLARKEAAKNRPGLVSGADPFALGESAQQNARALRAQDAAFQEADRLKRIREVIAEDAADNQKKETQITQSEINKRSRLEEMRMKAILAARNIDLQAAIDSQKQIAENEKLGIGERLQALNQYYTLRNLQAREQADAEKDILKENIKQGQAVAEQELVIDKNLAIEKEQILRDTGKIQTDIVKQNVDERVAARLQQSEREKQDLQTAENNEIEALEELYKKSSLTIDQFELAKLQIRNKYATLALQAEIKATKEILELRRARGEDVTALENKLAQAEQSLIDLGFELFVKTEGLKTEEEQKELDKRKAAQKKYHDALKDLAQGVANFFIEMNKAQFEKEKNNLADELELIKKNKKEEIDAVNASALSAEEKADRIAIINAKAETQEEQIEARKRQVQIEQARFERAQAIASIVLNTAVSVVKALAVAGPFSIPLAAAIGALGAVQLATALATPLPRYYMGRDGGPAEWAKVNDGGRPEVIEHPDGSAYIPVGRNVTTYLGEGDTVHKSIDDYVRSVGRMANRRAPGMEVNSAGHLQLRHDLEKQTRDMLAGMERNKSTMIVQNTWAGVQVSQENAAGFFRYIHKNVFK